MFKCQSLKPGVDSANGKFHHFLKTSEDDPAVDPENLWLVEENILRVGVGVGFDFRRVSTRHPSTRQTPLEIRVGGDVR